MGPEILFMFAQSLLLHLQVDFDVGMSRIDMKVIEPSLNNGKIDSSLKEMHRRRVPERVGADLLCTKGRASIGSLLDPSSDYVPNAEASNGLVVRIHEQIGAGGVLKSPLIDVAGESIDGVLPQGNSSSLSALSGQDNRERFS